MSFLTMLGNSFTATPNSKPQHRTARPKNPVAADLRIFKNGSVFPSETLTREFSLEYQNKTSENQGNGFDVIDSRLFSNTLKTPVPFIMIAPVAKKAGKVDLFNACTYNEDGTPNASVLTQGASSFGAELWAMLIDVYHLDNTKYTTQGYIDVNLEDVVAISDSLQKATNGIYYVPKTINRGDNAGQVRTVRRENLSIYVLSPVGIDETATTGNADVTETGTTTTKEQTETVRNNA